MKTKTTATSNTAPEASVPPLPRKLGANHGETAKRPRKHDNNFKQSKDLREDRGIRQLKASPKSQSARGGR
ncbi:MAG TPA: hypothetical protein PLB55_19250 [Prosthecobacter sp.]|jgi:hypothetical protein|nr:hypothetical protein [Prosthecobacter sp.]